jgi:hypothetical protein
MKKTLVIIFPAMMIGLELKRGAEKEAFHAWNHSSLTMTMGKWSHHNNNQPKAMTLQKQSSAEF